MSQVLLSTSQCFPGDAVGSWRIDSSTSVRINHEGGIADAYKQCEEMGLRRAGQCVIIRPAYNEADPVLGLWYFREWRSFNGGPFVESRWNNSPLMEG